MKKVLVLCMAAVMAMAALAGCGQNGQTSVKDQQAQVQSQEQTTVPATEQQAQEQQAAQESVVEDGVVMDPAQANLISEDQARQIALDKVDGAVAEDIWTFDLDYDDGRWTYEGEIHKGDWEYEFEINAENGNVIGWEKDHIYD